MIKSVEVVSPKSPIIALNSAQLGPGSIRGHISNRAGIIVNSFFKEADPEKGYA
jgi:hypothetical protein